MSNRLQQLHDVGQSIWLDFIDRTMLRNGDLARRIRDDALTGMTSNPTIFEKALAEGNAYDDQIRTASGEFTAMELFERIATTDVRDACDMFRPTFDAIHGVDGFVSIEVSPGAANDAQATIAEAQRLWATVGRPNVMVKVPGTAEGAKAVRELTAEGVNVNITLLFAISAYKSVIDAYMAGLEARLAAGKEIDQLHSVASFFVSRVDTEVDKRLDAAMKADPKRSTTLKPLGRPRGDRERQARLRALSGADRNAAVEGARRARRDGAAAAVGEHEHEESGLPRRDVRGRADRAGHREHDAAADDRSLSRPRRRQADGRHPCRGGAAHDRYAGARGDLDARRDGQAARRRSRQLREIVRYADRGPGDEDESAGQGAGREPLTRTLIQLHYCRTKIVCTLGPSSSTPDALRSLVDAGLNVARINFSHATHDQHAATIALVRDMAKEMKRPIAILGDLQGPRIRIGDLSAARDLPDGSDLTFAPEGKERGDEIPVTYANLAEDVHVGDRILINDGLLELVVLDVTKPRVTARVLHGGPLTSHKGINLPGVKVSAPSITDKDREDVAFAVQQELEYVALSFVRRAQDIAELRTLVPKSTLVVAKIEKDSALENIETIVRASDAVMVARGDLGVELPFEEVPYAQKRIISLCNRLGRPVITATQMLESMITHPRPTRAEASDVANAILDGTDAVMLSAETAAGQYPRLAVEAMSRIIAEIEKRPQHFRHDDRRRSEAAVSTEFAIAAASVAAVTMLSAPVLIVFTKGGFSARVVASQRPSVPILVLTDVPRTYRQLALIWGVVPELVPHCNSYDEMMRLAVEAVQRRGLARAGDRVVVTAGVPFDVPGTTNLLKVETV